MIYDELLVEFNCKSFIKSSTICINLNVKINISYNKNITNVIVFNNFNEKSNIIVYNMSQINHSNEYYILNYFKYLNIFCCYC